MVESSKTGSVEFGRLLVTARERLGMSRRELAEATELSYPYISQLETGYRQPSPAAIQKLADVLHLGLNELFDAMSPARPNRADSAPAPRPSAAAGGGSGWVTNRAYAGRRSGRAVEADGIQFAALAMEGTESSPPDMSQVVKHVTNLLTELPVEDRLDAVAKVQRRVVDSVVRDSVRRRTER